VEDLLTPTLPEFTLQQRFDAQLRLLRSQGMTQKAAAAALGVTLETIKSLEQKRLKKDKVR
jgi:DNA-binding XRE family transcriptional regulator